MSSVLQDHKQRFGKTLRHKVSGGGLSHGAVSRQQSAAVSASESAASPVDSGPATGGKSPLTPKTSAAPAESKLKKFRTVFARLYKKLGISHLIPFFIIIVYSLIGAAIFQAVEGPNDAKVRKEQLQLIETSRDNLSSSIERIFYARPALTPVKRRQELEKLYITYQNNIGYRFNEESIWTFVNAFYYCGTVYTTIGYGNMYPTTTMGQLITIFYAIIGIPLMLMTLNELGKLSYMFIHKCIAMFDSAMAKLCRCLRRKKHSERSKSATSDLIAAEEGKHAKPEIQLTERETDKTNLIVTNDTNEKLNGKQAISGEIKLDGQADLDDDEIDEANVKIPVSVALFVALGWIFLCAALFCIWEKNWTYFVSVYFIFISLSTIGLGDITPDHPEYMVGVFAFVIIGLSLVSMCISVVQERLQELYMQLLTKLLTDYQKKLGMGEDQVGATMGIMTSWNQSAAAKLLVPLLGNSSKEAVVRQFQETAKAQGIELPPVLQHVDHSTGLPSILSVKPAAAGDKEAEEAVKLAVEQKIKEVEAEIQEQHAPLLATTSHPPTETLTTLVIDEDPATEWSDAPEKLEDEIPLEKEAEEFEEKQPEPEEVPQEPTKEPPPPSVPTVVFYDANVETDQVYLEEQECQTESREEQQTGMQTESSCFACTEQRTQTHIVETWNNDSQTVAPEAKEQFGQTESVQMTTQDAQTVQVKTEERELQTLSAEFSSAEQQTENVRTVEALQQTISPPLRESGDQTTSPELLELAQQTDEKEIGEVEVQTDEVRFWQSLDDLREEEEEGNDTLEWDPIDGMHAEKQKPVGLIKKMFETGKGFEAPAARSSKGAGGRRNSSALAGFNPNKPRSSFSK